MRSGTSKKEWKERLLSSLHSDYYTLYDYILLRALRLAKHSLHTNSTPASLACIVLLDL